MMTGKPLLYIMFFGWLMVASGDSGKDNTYPDQVCRRRNANNPQTHPSVSYHQAQQQPEDEVVQCPNTTIEGKVDETATLPLKEKEKPCPDSVVQCPNATREGEVDKTVTLPCLAKDKADISLEQVEWLFEDPTTGDYHTILMYYQGKELKNQSKRFNNRTSLFKKELAFGNCSLNLNVTTSDNGTYYCSVQGHVCCPVTLKVLPKENPPLSPKMPGVRALMVGLGVGIPAFFIIVIIALGLCYY